MPRCHTSVMILWSGTVALVTTPSELSLEQKVDLLAGADTWHTVRLDDPPVPAIRMSDGPAGVRGTSWTGAASASFPCGAALGATWDPALVRRVGQAFGREAHSKNAQVLLGPDRQPAPHADRRSQLRVLSEDPVLTAELAVAYVSGVQSERVAACIKHFVGNDTEFERMTISSEIDERTLREIYLAAVRGRREAGRGVCRHGGLQPAQRHVLQRASVAAHRGAARRVGFRGSRHQRLVRQPQRGRVAAGRARPGDARSATAARSPAAGGGTRAATSATSTSAGPWLASLRWPSGLALRTRKRARSRSTMQVTRDVIRQAAIRAWCCSRTRTGCCR